jgi:hypothetical protein
MLLPWVEVAVAQTILQENRVALAVQVEMEVVLVSAMAPRVMVIRAQLNKVILEVTGIPAVQPPVKGQGVVVQVLQVVRMDRL